MLLRADITEGKSGLPLKLRIAVTDTATCQPLANAAVDIWHCDARGYYSGVSGENPGDGETTGDDNLDTTFLRGLQLTDDNGIAEFTTIYPGWYTGRATHIHMKVHVGGTAGEQYDGGHVSHTGQLFFDEDITNTVYSTAEAYADRDDSRRTLNDEDNILGDHDEEPGFLLSLSQLDAGTIEGGFLGEIVIGVDPSVTATEAGMGGGGPQGGQPGGGPGSPPPSN
jgi:protocatechuate 3,4-dioxygenase beta subunit